MINPLTSSLPKQGNWVLFIPENIILDNIMQNLLNLSMYYARRFLHLSLLSISIYTVHCLGKMVKRKLQKNSTPMQMTCQRKMQVKIAGGSEHSK